MPFKSEKQRRFMYAVHPDIAAQWEDEAKKAKKKPVPSKPKPKAKPVTKRKVVRKKKGGK